MPEPLMLANWRRFPRAHVRVDVTFRDSSQTWSSHTRDISLGGCRIAGYYPFAIGKRLMVQFREAADAEPLALIGQVARLYGGAQNSFALEFNRDARLIRHLETWMQKLILRYPTVKKTLTRMPEHLPVEAWLRRTALENPGRVLSPGEISVLQRVDRTRPIPFANLRRDWGSDWERKAQALFDLIADGMVACALKRPQPQQPTASAPSPSGEEFSVRSMIFHSKDLLSALEHEYGPLDKSFAMELEGLSREVSAGKKKLKD